MKIHVLVENMSGKQCSGEWGLSYFIEGEKNILFDFGASELFLENGKKCRVDFAKIDYLVLSHGHWDHGNGLQYLNKQKLVCHPDVFIKRYNGDREIGLPFNQAEAAQKFQLILTKEPLDLGGGFIFLGEIPRKNDFEAKVTPFVKEDSSEDYVDDDSALVYQSEDGLIIISGCSHRGICNIVDYGMKVTGIKKIKAVIGGFHLKKNDEITAKTIKFFRDLKVETVIPSHCTEFPALVEFYKEFGSPQIFTGQTLEF